LAEAIQLFLQSTHLDPAYAPAWVGLADAYSLLSLYGTLPPREVYPRAKAAALSALHLDPVLAEAHNALAVVDLFYEWDWAAAEAAFRRALELNPAYADGHQRYGMYLTVMGRFDEATEALRRAKTADPLSRIIATIAAYPAYYSRDYAAAIRQLRQVVQVDPQFSMAHFRMGLAYAHDGRFDDALAELWIARSLSNDRDVIAALGRVYGLMGRRDEAERQIAELQARAERIFVTAYALAIIYAALGDHERALELLEQAVDERSYWVIYLNVDPALDPLRGLPRFEELRHRAGLAPA
jgi:tetratricopeptide (TPR) repeat protein